MIREAEALRKRGLCVLDATSLIKCTTRYDVQHTWKTLNTIVFSRSVFTPRLALWATIFIQIAIMQTSD